MCHQPPSVLLSPSSSRNSAPKSHGRLFSPLPSTLRASHHWRKKSSEFSPLVDSRETCLSTRSQTLVTLCTGKTKFNETKQHEHPSCPSLALVNVNAENCNKSLSDDAEKEVLLLPVVYPCRILLHYSPANFERGSKQLHEAQERTHCESVETTTRTRTVFLPGFFFCG